MITDKLKEYLSAVSDAGSGDICRDIQALAQKVIDGLNDTATAFGVTVEIFGEIMNRVKSNDLPFSFTMDMPFGAQDLFGILQSQVRLAYMNDDTGRIVKLTTNDQTIVIERALDGEPICTFAPDSGSDWSGTAISVGVSEAFGQFFNTASNIQASINDFLVSVASGRAIADMASRVGMFITGSTEQITTNLMTTVTSIVNSFTTIAGDVKNELLAAVCSGKDAFFAWFANLYAKTKKSADDGVIFNSTDITVRTFSAGVIITTISTIVTAVGSIVAAIAPIVGFIVGTIGFVGSAIGKVILAATTDIEDTNYKMHPSAAPDFSFCVSQFEAESPLLWNFLDINHLTVGCIHCPCTGTDLYVYKDQTEGRSGWVKIEEHLSMQFNLVPILEYERNGYYGNQPVFIVSFDGDLYTRTLEFGWPFNYADTTLSNYGMCPAYVFGVTGPNNKPDTSKNPTPYELGMAAYAPINVNLVTKVKNFFTDEYKAEFDQRLLTSMFLYAYARFYFSLYWHRNDVIAFNKDGVTSMGLPICIWTRDNTISSGQYTLLDDWVGTASSIYGTILAYSSKGLYNICRDIYNNQGASLNNNERDYLIAHVITSCFDGVPLSYNQPTIPPIIGLISCGNDFNYNGTQVSALVADDDCFFQISYWTVANKPVVKLGSSWYLNYCFYWEPTLIGDITGDLDNAWNHLNFRNNFTVYWPNTFQVEIPSLTFSGFLEGLIIDGFILLATAVAAVGIGFLWYKISNYRSQLQAQAEGAWYDYEDNYDPEDAVANSDRWQAYKKARFKYNILALATGGTTLGKGLYDDGSSMDNLSSVVSQIVGGTSSTVTASDCNLQSIIALIKGF